MSAGIKAFLLYWIAGASLIGAWWAPQLLGSHPTLQVLRNVGWGVWTVAVALIWASLLSSRSRGKAQRREDGPCASMTIGGGIYAVIRHPRYLGWLLVYVAVMMLLQHWVVVACAVPGMVCVYLISIREDLRLLETLGSAYEQYMRCVPALNLVAGLTRLLRRRVGGPPAGGAHATERCEGEDKASPECDGAECDGEGCEVSEKPHTAGNPDGVVPEGYCFCLICGHRKKQAEAALCSQNWCPKCGARMMHN